MTHMRGYKNQDMFYEALLNNVTKKKNSSLHKIRLCVLIQTMMKLLIFYVLKRALNIMLKNNA